MSRRLDPEVAGADGVVKLDFFFGALGFAAPTPPKRAAAIFSLSVGCRGAAGAEYAV